MILLDENQWWGVLQVQLFCSISSFLLFFFFLPDGRRWAASDVSFQLGSLWLMGSLWMGSQWMGSMWAGSMWMVIELQLGGFGIELVIWLGASGLAGTCAADAASKSRSFLARQQFWPTLYLARFTCIFQSCALVFTLYHKMLTVRMWSTGGYGWCASKPEVTQNQPINLSDGHTIGCVAFLGKKHALFWWKSQNEKFKGTNSLLKLGTLLGRKLDPNTHAPY